MGSGYITYHGVKKDYSVFKARVDGSLTEVTAEMLDGITSIARSAFNNCSSLTSVNIPNTVTSIGTYAFSQCTSLASATLSNSLTIISESIFNNCSALASVTIPSSVTNIGYRAFYGCSSLTSIDIPSGVTWIGSSAFNSCSSLASVTVRSTAPHSLGSNAFADTSNNLVIYVPAGSVEAYKTASGWSDYESRIQAIP